MNPDAKLLASLDEARQVSECHRDRGSSIALTSGCFDLVHGAHLRYLHLAAGYANVLFVGINSDEGVRRLKSPDRPIRPESDRAYVVAGFGVVDHAVIFADDVELIRAIRPDVYVASATSEVRINDDHRRLRALAGIGAEIVEIGRFSSLSSTAIIQQAGMPRAAVT